MPKRLTKTQPLTYPFGGNRVTIPLISLDETESFYLDISSGQFNLTRKKYQNRFRNVVLVRLEINGCPHRNPDGATIGPNHIHIYREGFGDRWAFQVPNDDFMYIDPPRRIFADFLTYCNITETPEFIGELFP